MTITMSRLDELPAWVATIDVNGTLPDLSTGWTFTVTASQAGQDDVVKTTGITGGPSGVVTVQWSTNELDINPGTWRLTLVAKRSSDQAEFTVRDRLYIRPR